MLNQFFLTVWQSAWFGALLWLLLVAVLFAPLITEWWHARSRFDIFESKNIFRAVYFLYFGVPSLYYLLYPRSFNYVYNFSSSLRLVLIYAIVGALFFYVGYLIPQRWKIQLPVIAYSVKRLLLVIVGATVVSVISFTTLMHRVGGACYYFTHLGQTNELMIGNTYFLWGILLVKSSALLLLMHALSSKTKSWWMWGLAGSYTFVSILLLTFMGSRILLVVFIFEILMLIHYLYKRLHILWLLGVMLVIIVLVIGVLGEFRNFSWIAPNACSSSSTLSTQPVSQSQIQSTSSSASLTKPTSTPVDAQVYVAAFGKQLEVVTSDKQLLADRYIDNYFDSVRTTMMAIDNTPFLIKFQYGTGYLQVLVQPIPRHYRPNISVGGASKPIFSEGGDYGRVVSLLGEAYINFWLFGIALIPLLLGVYARFIYKLRLDNSTNPWAVVLYAIGVGGLMVWIRGYFVGHTVLFLIDLLPFLLGMWLLQLKGKS